MSNRNLKPSPAATVKHLTFKLAAEEYAIPILKVHEIIAMMDITMVPRLPEFVRGVVNLRGKIIPVIDLRITFGMAPSVRSDATCIVVVEAATGDMGLIVDSVCEVLEIGPDATHTTPSFGAGVPTEFLVGMGKVGGRVQLIVNVERVLSRAEAASLDIARVSHAPGR